MTRNRALPIFGSLLLGGLLMLLAVSWLPLWQVEPPSGHLGEIRGGSFWGFLRGLPRALEEFSTPQDPENILAILPRVFLWDNVGITLIVLAIGMAGGLAIRWQWQFHRLSRQN